MKIATSTPDERLAAFARANHDVATSKELTALGFNAGSIKRRTRRRTLHRCAPGVYVVGSGSITAEGRMRAAVLASGSSARVATWGAMYLHGVTRTPPSRIEVLSKSSSGRTALATITRTTSIPECHTTVKSGIPCTTVSRALVDLSERCDPNRLLKLMSQARFRRELDVEDLRCVIERLKHRGSCDNVRRALMWLDLGATGADSELELRFLRLLVRAGMKLPLTGVHLAPLRPKERVDCVWHDEMVVVEVDGPHHLDEDVQRNDRRRDAALRRAGYTVIRIWWWEIEETPLAVIERVAAALPR